MRQVSSCHAQKLPGAAAPADNTGYCICMPDLHRPTASHGCHNVTQEFESSFSCARAACWLQAGAGSAGQQQQVPTCPLLQSGVLSVLLHHPCITNSTSIICRLMCCSAELKTIIATHCIGLVHVTLSDLPIPIDWMRQHAHLLRCLELKFRLLKLEELVKAERGLVHVLKYSTSSLKLSSFVSECDQVSVPMLKRLPVSKGSGWWKL